jgi:hypothetical protein
MSKDVIKLPVVLVVLVGSAFNVEIHKNASALAWIRPFAFPPSRMWDHEKRRALT